MTGSEFLTKLLTSQRLQDGCAELNALDAVRIEVERLIRTKDLMQNYCFTRRAVVA